MATTKEKIIEAVALTLNENFNYDELSMSAIAEKVGIGKSTIYEYFESKSDLLVETIKGIVDLYIKQILEHDLTNLNFHDAFTTQILDMINCGFNKRVTLKIFTQLDFVLKVKEQEIKEKIEEGKKEILARFSEIFNKGLAEKVINYTYDVRVETLVGGIISAMICQQMNEPVGTNEELAEYLYGVLVKVLN